MVIIGIVQPHDTNKKILPNAALLPPISVRPQASAPAETSIISDARNALSHTIGDAQAAVNMTPLTIAKSNSVITLHHNSDYIVGQMARIPVDSEQITEIQPANNIDNHAARDLLSILSQY